MIKAAVKLACVADGQPYAEHLKTGKAKEVNDRLPGFTLYLNYPSISGHRESNKRKYALMSYTNHAITTVCKLKASKSSSRHQLLILKS
jgi:hypothetical protein